MGFKIFTVFTIYFESLRYKYDNFIAQAGMYTNLGIPKILYWKFQIFKKRNFKRF